MLFSEIYSSYFNVLAAVLEEAVKNRLTEEKITEIIKEKAFAESIVSIPEALKRDEWKLLQKDLKTPLAFVPTMPLTTLQKRWMKALLLDPRIRLFSPDESGLEEIKPLYNPSWFVYFDRYKDGDPYTEEAYIEHFKMILKALEEKCWLEIYFNGGKGRQFHKRCFPFYLEYSSKDDQFRLLASDREPWCYQTINLSRIIDCRIMRECTEPKPEIPEIKNSILEFDLIDERGALDRVMLHFSHLKKETRQLEDNRYHVTLYYDHSDEKEILIRILSFGPMIRVTSPDSFIKQIRERIEKQINVKQNRLP